MFEEVGIGFVGDAAIGLMRRQAGIPTTSEATG